MPIREKKLTVLKRIRYGAEAAGFFLLMGIFKLLGVDLASAAGGFLGRHVFIRLPPVKIARENLRASYPELSDDAREAILREHIENIGRTVGEYPHLGKMTLGKRIEVVGLEHAESALAVGKGVMFISGHFANWEVMPVAGRQIGYDGGVVQRSPNNPFVARWIDRQRSRYGAQELIEKGPEGTRRVFTRLRKNKAVYLLVDQKTGQGVPTPFFGRDAMTTHAPAALSLKLGSLLLPIWAERLHGAHFRVVVLPPLQFTASGDNDADILALTAAITAQIEELVRRRPSQWLWIHRRWPSKRDKVRRINRLIQQDPPK